MPEGVHTSGTLLEAPDLARSLILRSASNGLRFAIFGESRIPEPDIVRIVEAVPAGVAPALAAHAFYFVPLAIPQATGPSAELHRTASDRTFIAPIYTEALAEEAICHRNVAVPETAGNPAHDGVFISAALLRDTFALAFEFFINVGHLFVGEAGIPESFATLAWTQAQADVRGETSQDAWESRHAAITSSDRPDEKARGEFLEAAFADALAVYLLSLAVDFDYAELREREYPLLAPSPLADRLRLIARLFPPRSGYEFSIRYRRRP